MKGIAHSSKSHGPASAGSADFDFEAELRPEVSRRASNAAIRRLIQKREREQQATEDTHAAAARGIALPPTTLPYSDRIQASFGPAHDVSNIQAHVGGDSATAMGATAFASGNHVVFDQSPDLHTAAHEAAHVVQQAQGVNLYGGVGQAGDAYERHADAVADRVVAGASSADLLAAAPGGSSTTAIQKDDKHAATNAVGGQGPYLTSPGSGMTTRPQGFVKTGDPVADAGSCNFKDGPGCFLSPTQRVQVVTAFCTHVEDLRFAFHEAILQLRMDKLAESDAETSVMGTIIGIVFGIVTGWMGAALGAAMKAAASNATGVLAEAELLAGTEGSMVDLVATAPELPGRFATALTHVSPGAIDATTKGLSSVAASRLSAILAVGAADGDSKHTQKSQAVEYMDDIAESTNQFYMSYRNGMLQSNDATLVTLCHAFATPPKIPDLKAQLSAKVEHFMSSNLPKIGRQVRNTDREVSGMGKPLMEMRVAWVIDAFTHTKRLGYFDRAFVNPGTYDRGQAGFRARDDNGAAMQASDWLGRDFYGGAGEPGFSLADAPKGSQSPMYPALEDGDHFVGYVEDDLVELALQHHDRVWMSSPANFYFNPATGKFTKDKP